jgi:hypothetical protein
VQLYRAAERLGGFFGYRSYWWLDLPNAQEWGEWAAEQTNFKRQPLALWSTEADPATMLDLGPIFLDSVRGGSRHQISEHGGYIWHHFLGEGPRLGQQSRQAQYLGDEPLRRTMIALIGDG